MLRPPYTHYEHLYVYHLDLPTIPDVSDPDLIGIWIEDLTAVLFFHKEKKDLVAEICHQYGCQVIYQADLDYRDWEAGQLISSFSVGGVSVAPVWENTAADIRLDPSVIFGSGFHPTTRTCLELLLKYCNTPEVKVDTLLDLGTGTGLLAIAAALQGTQQVTAVDNNPLACQVAQANCILNKVDSQVDIQQRDLRTELPDTGQYNLVVANLYRGLLEQLFKTPSFWQADLFILSGFIHSMEAELLAEIPGDSLRFLERKRKDQWCIWVLANRNRGK